MAHVRLQISNIPNLFEHRSFTLIGGGLDQKGFHGEHASGFTGIGVHFAKIAGESSPNPIRTPEYKKDYTRPVTNGVLVFDMYYEPTDITIWGERYPTGSNLALTLMPKGGTERVMHAGNNPFNWSFGGISIGKSVTILLEIP